MRLTGNNHHVEDSNQPPPAAWPLGWCLAWGIR
jgi:hypothetical protein